MKILKQGDMETVGWITHCDACNFVATMPQAEVLQKSAGLNLGDRIGIIKRHEINEVQLLRCPKCDLSYWKAYKEGSSKAIDIMKFYVTIGD